MTFIPKTKNGFSYSVAIVEEHGRFPIVEEGEEYIILIATMKPSDLFFDPENFRLKTESKNGFTYSKAGQKKLQEALQSGKLEKPTKALKHSMEDNQGQNEAIWVHFENGKATIKEGNRRAAVINSLGWEEVLVYVFPDEMPEEHVLSLVDQRHVGSICAWDAAIRAERAYSYLVEREFDINQITRKLMFNSSKDTSRFIHAYIWWKDSGLPMEEWSKFYHACIPRLQNIFGYDENHWKDGSAPFKENFRKSTREGRLSPKEVDEIIRETSPAGESKPKGATFDWFVQLIKDGKLTDCRQPDGFLGPALDYIDQPYGPETIKRLQSKPKSKPDKSKNGKGPPQPDTPAQMAWVYFRESRHENHLAEKTQSLITEFSNVLNSTKRLSQYQKNNSENLVLSGHVMALKGILEQFLDGTGVGIRA